MKKSLNQTLLFLIILCTNTNVQAQWSQANLEDPTYRSGKVGIGLSAPQAKLQISNIRQAIRIFNPTDNNPFILPSSPPTPHLRFNTFFEEDGTSTVWDIDAPGSLNFNYVQNANTTPTLAMSLSQNGGLSISGNRLTVGNQKMRLNTDSGKSIFNAAAYHIGFGLRSSHKENAGTYFNFSDAYGNTGGTVIQGDAYGNLLFITKAQNQFPFITANQNSDHTGMIITGTQKVLIGTTEVLDHPSNSEQDYKLFIAGGMVSNEIKVNHKVLIGTNDMPKYSDSNYDYKLIVNGGLVAKEVKVRSDFADYVFEKDYPLLSLKAVEAHIKEKGHLHNTPSAKEIQKNGLNLSEITTNQQEKIEELFLHLIEMEKKIDKLQQENKNLKWQLLEKE